MNIVTEKMCSTCKEVKPAVMFGISKRTTTGLRSQCKNCEHIYYEKNKERCLRKSRESYKSRFGEKSERQKIYNLANADKIKAYARKWHFDNSRKRRDANLKRIYGIGQEDFDRMLNEQGGRCKICGTTEPGIKGFVIDHDHISNKVRGILCHKCNLALGGFKDDVEIMKNAIRYIMDAD